MTECYLHGFGDASKKAYCAMVYLMYHTDDVQTHVRLPGINYKQNKSCPLVRALHYSHKTES